MADAAAVCVPDAADAADGAVLAAYPVSDAAAAEDSADGLHSAVRPGGSFRSVGLEALPDVPLCDRAQRA